MRVGVITDSHSGILSEEAVKLGIKVLPMPFFVEEECYYEEVSITREQLFAYLNEGKRVSTSQPSLESVMECWREGLKEYDQIVYLPMSSGLSGSCYTAMALAQEEEFENKVFVVDHGRVSTPLHRTVLDALELVNEGFTAPQIKEILEKTRENMSIYVAVETMENLRKSGRISQGTAAIGTILNIKPILKLGTEVLETHSKCRGMKKARREMIDAIRHDLDTTFGEYYDKGEVYLMAATSADEETTADWVREIKEAFPGMEVLCDYLTLGLSCHIGEGALGIGFSSRPRR